VSGDGQTLLADFVGPASVAAAMTWAYPSLSIEGPPPGWVSATGRSHELVVSAVALLGVHWPGVTTLDDFHEFLADGPKIEQTEAPEEVLARMPQRPRGVRAGLDVDLVARRFIDQVDSGELERPDGVGSAFSLWVTAIRLDDTGSPYLKVIDEENGTLYRVNFTVNGPVVSFGEFVEVIEQDVPVAAAAGVPRPAAPLARWGSREVLRAAVSNDIEGASSMTDEQRRTLAAAHGLDPDSATEEQVMERVVAAVAETPPDPARQPDTDPPQGPAGDPETEPAPEQPAEQPEPQREEPEPVLTATVSRAQWEAQQATIQRLEAEANARRDREARDHRDGLVRAALSDGRIAPSERDTWRRELDTAPDATERLLASLRPNAVPVAARGVDSVDEQPSEGTGWFNFETAGA
jgi:hypothetical protein